MTVAYDSQQKEIHYPTELTKVFYGWFIMVSDLLRVKQTVRVHFFTVRYFFLSSSLISVVKGVALE